MILTGKLLTMENTIISSSQTSQNTFLHGAGSVINFFEKYNESISKELARRNAEIMEKTQFERRTKAIASIIKEDPSTPKDVSQQELALEIHRNTKETGIDPLLLVCLCKKETHFDQKRSGNNGKGITQLTSIAMADMYQRAQLYDDTLKVLISKYKTLDKVFAAKNNNPKLYLGDFGEMLYKYKTPENLYNAIKKDRNLNLKCSAYAIKFHLNATNGDVRKALENYNTTYEKKEYASNIIRYMESARALVRINAYC